MNIDLTGKRAIVCGSTKGIGRAIALELADLGAEVILLARNKEQLKETLSQLSRVAKQHHEFLCADFRDPNDVRDVINSYMSKSSAIHILVNNSGGPPPGQAIDAEVVAFQNAFNQHLICNQVLVQAIAPSMKEEGYGRIINVVSTSVRTPIPGLGVSNTIRGSVASWAKTLSAELGPYGITVNNILPGLTETDRLKSLIETRASESQVSFDEQVEKMKKNIPLRRFASPSETAALAGFLASRSAAFISGESIRVDGGATPSI